MEKVLVTGGAGFIGSHLCRALLRTGRKVRVLDDLSTGKVENLPPDVEFLRGNIAEPTDMARALAGVDACCHLAAIASVERAVQDWPGTHRVNQTATILLFDAIRARPIPVVYASSAAVYGNSPDLPLTEGSAGNPQSAYGADKFGCELHAAVANRVFSIPTVGLRFFNVYGPRQDPRSPYSGVISIFCDRITRGAPVTIYGDGRQTRDFIHVSDVVAAILAALEGGGPEPLVFNVCSGTPTSVLELAHTIGGLAGRTPDIRFGPPRVGDIRNSFGSPARVRETFALPTAGALRDGLATVLAWMDGSGSDV